MRITCTLISRKVPSREDKDNNLTVSHIWYYNNLGLDLRIDKGSPWGALYLGTCIHNNESCNGILYIL